MFSSGEEEGDFVLAGEDDYAGGERAGALGVEARVGLNGKDGHAGVVVMKNLALGGLIDEAIVNGFDDSGDGMNDVPLGGTWKWDAKSLLEFFHAMKGHACAVFHEGDDAAGVGVVFFMAGFQWKFGGEDFAAQAATQFFGLVYFCGNHGLSGNTEYLAGRLLIDSAVVACGAGVARFQVGMWDGDDFCAGVIVGTVTAMSFGRFFVVVGSRGFALLFSFFY